MEGTQKEVFCKELEPAVQHVFDGFNTTVFAFGATGTGKTHTMHGTQSDPGMIPQVFMLAPLSMDNVQH